MKGSRGCSAELSDALLELGKPAETCFYTDCSWGKEKLNWHWCYKTHVSVLQPDVAVTSPLLQDPASLSQLS